MLVSANFGDLLEPGLRKIFVDQYARLPQMRTAIFNVDTLDTSYYKDSSVGGFSDFEVFQGTVQYDDAFQNFDVTYRPVEFAKGFKVERKLFDDDLYGVIARLPRNLSRASAITQEKHAASIFNNAFSGTGTITLGGIQLLNNTEAQSLCSTAHDIGTGNAITQSNSGTTALSATAVEATRRNMARYVDDRNQYIAVVPDLLLVPRALEETAWEIVASAGKVNTAENNQNFHYGRYKLAVWDYLGDDNNWFMIDTNMMKDFLNWFDRIGLEFYRDKDFDTLTARFAAYMRFAYGWSDWRWVFGNNVS